MNFDKIVDQISSVGLGKNEQIRLALICLLAKGHLLIEDIPGIGKTTLAKVLSKLPGFRFSSNSVFRRSSISIFDCAMLAVGIEMTGSA